MEAVVPFGGRGRGPTLPGPVYCFSRSGTALGEPEGDVVVGALSPRLISTSISTANCTTASPRHARHRVSGPGDVERGGASGSTAAMSGLGEWRGGGGRSRCGWGGGFRRTRCRRGRGLWSGGSEPVEASVPEGWVALREGTGRAARACGQGEQKTRDPPRHVSFSRGDELKWRRRSSAIFDHGRHVGRSTVGEDGKSVACWQD